MSGSVLFSHLFQQQLNKSEEHHLNLWLRLELDANLTLQRKNNILQKLVIVSKEPTLVWLKHR